MSHNEPQPQSGNGQVSTLPDPEVVPKAERRRFSADYKRRILQEAAACTQPGEVGALLRREGLYSSHLTTWRQATPTRRTSRADARPARSQGRPASG